MLVTLDFEASSLEMTSYPIEVGVTYGPAHTSDPTTFAVLVRQLDGWTAQDVWSDQAEETHGIRQVALASGHPPADVMRQLNERIPQGSVALCDGGDYDRMWLRRLAKAAGIAPTFQLWDIRTAFVLDRRRLDRCSALLHGEGSVHRAGPDSLRLWRAVAGSV